MIRSAAKNHERVAVVVDPADYARVLAELDERRARSRPRRGSGWRRKAFAHTAAYDGAIAVAPRARLEHAGARRWPTSRRRCTSRGTRARSLRYGENPHQKAAFYALEGARRGPSLARRRGAAGEGALVQQPARSRRGVEAAAPSSRAPAAAIVKHNNPCGAAVADGGRGRGLPAGARDRSGVGLRRHRRGQPRRSTPCWRAS